MLVVERDVVFGQQVGDQFRGAEVLGRVVPLVAGGVHADVLDADGPLVVPEVPVLEGDVLLVQALIDGAVGVHHVVNADPVALVPEGGDGVSQALLGVVDGNAEQRQVGGPVGGVVADAGVAGRHDAVVGRGVVGAGVAGAVGRQGRRDPGVCGARDVRGDRP